MLPVVSELLDGCNADLVDDFVHERGEEVSALEFFCGAGRSCAGNEGGDCGDDGGEGVWAEEVVMLFSC